MGKRVGSLGRPESLLSLQSRNWQCSPPSFQTAFSDHGFSKTSGRNDYQRESKTRTPHVYVYLPNT